MTLFDDNSVSLATTDNRVRCDLVLPDDKDGYQHQYLNSDEWEVSESTLTIRGGDYYLHLGFRQPKSDSDKSPAEDRTVLEVVDVFRRRIPPLPTRPIRTFPETHCFRNPNRNTTRE